MATVCCTLWVLFAKQFFKSTDVTATFFFDTIHYTPVQMSSVTKYAFMKSTFQIVFMNVKLGQNETKNQYLVTEKLTTKRTNTVLSCCGSLMKTSKPSKNL